MPVEAGHLAPNCRLSGRRVPAPKTFTTRRDASRWLARAEAEQGRGWIDPSAGRVQLSDYAREWLQGQVRLAPRIKEIYETQLRLYVLPRIEHQIAPLGEHPLDRITPELVRSWYAALVRTRGKSVAAKSYTRLRQILGQAVNDERIARNPCRIEGAGVEAHPEQRIIGIKELYKLAEGMPERYRALVLAAGLGGIREGELFALRRSDIDLDSGVVRIRRKRLRLASGEVIEGEPKSKAGRRVVALPNLLSRSFVSTWRDSSTALPTRTCSQPRLASHSSGATSVSGCGLPPGLRRA